MALVHALYPESEDVPEAQIALRTLISICNARTTNSLSIANLGQRIDLPEDLAVRTTTPAPVSQVITAQMQNAARGIPQPKEPKKRR